MKKVLAGAVIVVVSLFVMSVSMVLAQALCQGNFDCDQDVDGTDAAILKADFGRSQFQNPCPPYDQPFPCNPCPYGMIDCETKCVDPMTDEDFCGVDSTCLGGTICGVSEKCVLGICENVGGGGGYPAPVPKTGQTRSYASFDDGEYERGVTWPNPRFTDNSDGTIKDNLTGLIWLKDARCLGRRTWYDALDVVHGLADGTCGLTDGSQAGDWKLPNKRELISLTHDGYDSFALPNTAGTGQWSEGDPFIYVDTLSYWSSTTNFMTETSIAWIVCMDDGHLYSVQKADYYRIWAVRGPE